MKKNKKKVVKLLAKKRYKISFAESCTGGLLSSCITSINGSSKVFTLGLVTYSNQAKINILKVSKKIIIKHGAVSYETCLSMVKNLNKISKTNISVSITGIAGPKGGTEVSFDIDFEIENKFLNVLMEKSFEFGLNRIADAFQKRAEKLFSKS